MAKGKAAQSLGDRIRRSRRIKGLTQTELGDQVGLSKRMIAYYEVQGGSLSSALLVKFAEALDVSTDELVGKARTRRQPPTPPEKLRLWRRFKRVEELPDHDRKTVLKMIDALADRAGKRRAG